MPIENPKTLDQLIDFFNENPEVFGWKSRCEELIIFAERLEQWLTDRDKLVEQMRALLNAVECSEFEGPICFDVGGENWYDAREAALSAAERLGQ